MITTSELHRCDIVRSACCGALSVPGHSEVNGDKSRALLCPKARRLIPGFTPVAGLQSACLIGPRPSPPGRFWEIGGVQAVSNGALSWVMYDLLRQSVGRRMKPASSSQLGIPMGPCEESAARKCEGLDREAFEVLAPLALISLWSSLRSSGPDGCSPAHLLVRPSPNVPTGRLGPPRALLVPPPP